MKRLLFFIFFCLSSFAEDSSALVNTFSDTSPFIDGKVNAISGDFLLSATDLAIDAPETLFLTRSYVSGDGLGYYAGWELFAHTVLILKDERVHVADSSGAHLTFKYKETKDGIVHMKIDLGKRSIGYTNTSRGEISGQTNLRNYRINFPAAPKRNDHYVLTTANGTKRYYKQSSNPSVYFLEKEQLPNGNKILYSYTKENLLSEISTYDPTETWEYAWMRFSYSDPKQQDRSFEVRTSDKRRVKYHFEPREEGLPKIYLHSVEGDVPQKETFKYHSERKKCLPKLARFSTAHQGEGLLFYIFPNSYEILPKIENKNDPRIGRVSRLLKKVENREIQTHSFTYSPSRLRKDGKSFESTGKTIVNSPWLTQTFDYDNYLRPTKITKSTKDKLISVEKFLWSQEERKQGNLLKKAFFDSEKELYSHSYYYDEHFNPKSESFNAYISSPTEQTRCSTSRTFTKDDFHLLLEEKRPDHQFDQYEYLEETNLVIKHVSGHHNQITKREFTEYDEHYLPTKIIIDDGASQEAHNLQNVTERRITKIFYRNFGHSRSFLDYNADFLTSTPIDDSLNPSPESERQFEEVSKSSIYRIAEIREEYLDLSTNREILLKKTVFSYDETGRISSLQTYDANEEFHYKTSYKYDRVGRITEEIDPLGRKTLYSYDNQGNLSSITDPSGLFITSFSYDKSHNPLSKTITTCDGRTRTTKFSYNDRSLISSSTDHLGRTTQFNYDSLSRCVKITLPQVLSDTQAYHPIEQKTHNALGHEIKTLTPDKQITERTCNFFGNPFLIKHPDKTQETFTYSGTGDLLTHTLPSKAKQEFTYDWAHRITSQKTFDPNNTLLKQETNTYNNNHLIKSTDPQGFDTLYTYDPAGRLTQEQCKNRKITFSYDSLGRLHKKSQEDVVLIFTYDALNRIIEERTEDPTGTPLLITSYSYNSLGEKSREIKLTQEGTSSYEWLYDPFGRIIEELDPLGNRTHISYTEYTNQLGQLCEEITTCNPEGQLTIQRFDSLGRPVSTEKRSLFAITISLETYTYDNRGNLIHTDSHLLETDHTKKEIYSVILTYDDNNRITSRTEGTKTFSYTYDHLGNLKQKTLPSNIALHHSYDCLGNLLTLTSSDNTISYHYSYNKNDQIIQVEDRITQTTSHRSYNAFGEMISDTLPSNLTFTNTYDNAGRRTSLHLPDHSSIHYTHHGPFLKSISRKNYTHTYDQYDLSGNLLQETLFNNTTIKYRVNKNSTRVASTSPYSFHTIDKLSKTGHPLQITSSSGQKTYTYDILDQLTSDSIHTYTYNSRYTRTSKDDLPVKTNSNGEILQFETTAYTYDPSGNCTSKGNWEFKYDALGRMTHATSPSTQITYTYDSWNRRISKTVNAKTTYFLYDNLREIGALTNEKITELRILGQGFGAEIGASIAIELSNTTYIPLHDLQGNIISLIDPNQNNIEETSFTPFGEEDSTGICPWRFSSKRLDPETKFYYFGNRYYDPEIGTWLSPDPLENLYPYTFANNSPLHFTDLYGLFEQPLNNIEDLIIRIPPERRRLLSVINPPAYEEPRIYEIGANPHPKISIMLFNGMSTFVNESIKRGYEASDFLDEIFTIVCNNPTHGVLDLGEAILQKCGIMCRVDKIAEIAIRRELKRIDDDGKVYAITFSQGALTFKNATKNLSEDDRRRIYVVSIGPACMLKKEDYRKADNYVSRNDWISRGVNFLFSSECSNNKNAILLDSLVKGLDHAYYSPTYQEHLNRYLETIKDQINGEMLCYPSSN